MRAFLRRRWHAFRPLLKETPARFPLPFACALVFTAVMILGFHDFTRLDDLEGRILWFCVIGFFLFLAVHLLGEARGWGPLLSSAVGLGFGGLLAWRVGTADLESFWSSGLNYFLAPACVLAVMAAPFVPRPVVFLSTYVLVPLAIGYFAILYAFMVKIAVQWDLPRGEVATLIMIYAAFGVAVHLIAHPLREGGAAHVRAFLRWFYPALLVPALLLALAIYVRVEAYGITEDRYLVMAFAAWLLLLVPFMTIRPRSGLAVAPLSLAALLALGSFGPWGAEARSLSSQLGRLERLLVEHGLLESGRIASPKTAIPRDEVVRISSIVSYLRDSGKHLALAPWFEGRGLDLAARPYAEEIVEAMGLTYLSHPDMLPGFHFSGQATSVLGDVRGFDLLGEVQIQAYGEAWQSQLEDEATAETYGLTFDPETGRFTTAGPEGRSLTFDLNALVQTLIDQKVTGAAENLTLERGDGAFRVRLVFRALSGQHKTAGPRIQSGQIQVLIDRGMR